MINRKLITLKVTVASLFMVFLLSCSTKKNTMTSRVWHNLNAHYNVFFNGNESYKEGLLAVDTKFQENYSLFLPVFNYDKKEVVSVADESMENTLLKASKCIKRHSITARPKPKKKSSLKKTDKEKEFENKPEYCKWIDECYLLMGKAHFYRQDFLQAIKSFKFIEKTYPKNPTRFNAMLWNAKCYIQSGKLSKAKDYFALIEAEKEFPEKLKRDLALAKADFYLKQDQNKEAIPYLEEAVERYSRFGHKRIKARYRFILAQLYHEMGQDDKAFELYELIIKKNPDYEMAFNAKINRALSVTEDQNAEDIIRQLNKMLEDDKNIEFQDQIYYALGDIAMDQEDTVTAISFFGKSIQTSVRNRNQKAMSNLALANIYYNIQYYDSAAIYYENTMTNLDTDYPDYEKVSIKTKMLQELIKNIMVIEREDSLQRLASMDEKEREKKIKSIIEQIKKEEESQRQIEMENQKELNDFQRTNRNSQSGSSWYFYNTNLISLGQIEFKKRWGDRPLEDNWRRSNKTVMASFSEDMEEAANSTGDSTLTNKDMEYYLKDLPLTDSALEASNRMMETAMFNSGLIYKEKLTDYGKAVEIFSALNTRFPGNIYTLEVYYNLYLCYLEMNNYTWADHYREAIIKEFSESKYAKFFTNPNYLNEVLDGQKQVEKLYEETFLSYKKRDYTDVLFTCNNAVKDYPDSKLLPNFMFLRAMSLGALHAPDTSKYVEALKGMIVKYPDSEPTTSAKQILEVLYNKGGKKFDAEKLIEESKTDEAKSNEEEIEIYTYEENALFYYVVALTDKKNNVNQLKFKIENFNIDYFRALNFTVSLIDFDKNTRFITVKSLSAKESANTYFNMITKRGKIFDGLNPKGYSHFYITEDNYIVLKKEKKLEQYVSFFAKNYRK